MRRVLLPLLITIGVVGIVGGVALWIHNDLFYYHTDAAQVESKLVSVDAPQPGTLTDISVKKGDTVQVDDKIGTERITGPNGDKDITLKSPVSGTIVLTTTKGSILTAGYPVAGINDAGVGAVGESTVVAYVDESVLNRLRIGQQADVTVDAYGHTIYTGHVEQIVRQAANQ
ncbi:MAG: HlyD family efflux transporter periplasmic adaptor subunit, partial [Chloroflexi bacterium]|nr:HlyD family efflux transporter periplasmic adaptor subunit [Chloroflexota bacterium]